MDSLIIQPPRKKKMNSQDRSLSVMIHHDPSWSIMINHDRASWIMIHHDGSRWIMIVHDGSWSIMIDHHRSLWIMMDYDQSWSKTWKYLENTKNLMPEAILMVKIIQKYSKNYEMTQNAPFSKVIIWIVIIFHGEFEFHAPDTQNPLKTQKTTKNQKKYVLYNFT